MDFTNTVSLLNITLLGLRSRSYASVSISKHCCIVVSLKPKIILTNHDYLDKAAICLKMKSCISKLTC